MVSVAAHNMALRNRAYAGLNKISRLEVVSVPRGPLATALVSTNLPIEIDSRRLGETLNDKHGIVIKLAEKCWFNDIRLSPHIFNTEADIDRALRALRMEFS